VEKPEGRRPRGRTMYRSDDYIKDLTKWGCVDLIFLAQDWEKWQILLNIFMNLWVP